VTYRPPPQHHRWDSDIQSSPPIMQYTIDASKDWFAQNDDPSTVADTIVQSYTSSIDRFISEGRQQNHLSELPQARHQASFPGLHID
jgi:hypothetical protein